QTLTFVARRLLAESVLMVFAAREPDADFRGLPELVVGGLREADARELLTQVVRWPLDERVQERIVAETRGNPLALLELPRGLSMTELAGGFGLPEASPTRCCCPAGSRTASCDGSASCPRRPGSCSWSRRRSLPVTRCWCGRRPRGSDSAWTLLVTLKRQG